MSPRSIAGLVIAGIGALLLFVGGSVPSRHNVMEIGDMKITATEQRSIPPWVGGGILVAGLALFAVGMGKRA
jgi:hypothetical protein